MEGGRATTTMKSKAEIDTSAPFRSVKEAVMLFGEKVLAGEVYASKLKEDGTSELQETKQSLQKAREETMQMARCLSSLQQELEQTKRELQRLKTTRGSNRYDLDLEIEDLKFVEDSPELIEQVKKETTTAARDQRVEFQKKKYVTFANPPSVAQVIVPPAPAPAPPSEAVLQRHPSLKKKKKKQLIPFYIGGIFSKKKGSSEVAFA